jgi:DNA-binding MarR family transcriptional regulator
MVRSTTRRKLLTKRQYEALSEFRYRLRRFLRFSENATRSRGMSPLHYQLMLHIQGFPGRDWATVGEIAERLQAHPHGVLALIARCEANGLVYRKRGTGDRRRVEVRLRPKGIRRLEELAALHHAEIRSMRDTIQVARLTASELKTRKKMNR